MALLDRGVAFRIPAPWLLRLFGKKRLKISVKRLRLGTLIHLSTLEALSTIEPMKVGSEREKVIKEMDASAVSLPYKVIVENRKVVCHEVAACLLNSHLKIFFFTKILARYLMWAINADQLQELVMWLFVYGRAESFTITTKLLEKMRLTNSRN